MLNKILIKKYNSLTSITLIFVNRETGFLSVGKVVFIWLF